MKMRLKKHIYACLTLFGGFFTILGLSVNQFLSWLYSFPLALTMFSLSLGTEITLRTSNYDKPVSYISSFLFCSFIGALGVNILIQAPDIVLIICGTALIIVAILLFITIIYYQNQFKGNFLLLLDRKKKNDH